MIVLGRLVTELQRDTQVHLWLVVEARGFKVNIPKLLGRL